ncbi:MAG: isoprenyl transferase [Planctomycetota bacterium]
MVDLPEERPTHVAIVMDGNGRWAEKRGKPRTEGHSAGAQSARNISECCIKFDIPYLTLYAFSTENWRRPNHEVRFLMNRLRKFLIERRDEMVEQGIALQPIGRLGKLPRRVRREMDATVQATRDGENLTLNLALNYGARAEITDACRVLARRVQNGELKPAEIDEALVNDSLYTAGQPDPDLFIRTGGEMRLSNFMLWQVSYAELYFTNVLWPDFGDDEFTDAIREYARRERRFGAV